MLRWLRELAATTGTFDRSSLEPGYALRCTAGVAIPLVVAAMIGEPALGVAAAIGAFITGFTSLQGIYRTRLTAILVAALGMSATSFVGALAAHFTPGVVAAAALAGYACATISQIGPVAATVALNSLVAFVLFSSQPLAPAAAAAQSGLVLAGGLIQAILVLVAWPAERQGVERRALAAVYRNLARYAREVEAGRAGIPPITPLATARQILADPQPFTRAAEIARLNRLLEDSEVIRRRLGALAATGARGAGLSALAESLDGVALTLTGARNAENALSTQPDLEFLQASGLAVPLRDAIEAAAVLATGRPQVLHLLSKPLPGPYVRNRVDWRSRDALRFALVLGAAMVLGRHFAADRGYWIPLTAAIVLKPDLQGTFARGAARIAGTLVGAVIASVAMAGVRAHPALGIPGILVAAATAYLTFNPSYALFTVAITSFVVMVLSMRGLPGTTAVSARVLDTLAGGALAMIGYVALPSWEHKRTRALLADLLDAQRRLAGAILRAYGSSPEDSRAAIDAARTDVWKIRTTVEASIDRTRREPHRPHTIGAGRALRILAATQRFALANLALEAALETRRPSLGAGVLEPFSDALDSTMSELAQALREHRRARLDDGLTAALARLAALLGAGDAEQRVILDRLRAYADAAARLARLIGVEKPLGVDSAQL